MQHLQANSEEHRALPLATKDSTNKANGIKQRWKAEDIGLFNPEYHDPANPGPVISLGRHTLYRNIYAFTDQLKDLAKASGKLIMLRDMLPTCFKGAALIWHSTELTDLEKDLLRTASIKSWYAALIKRFKKRISVALHKLQSERYTMKDARDHKSPRAFAQKQFRLAKAAEITSIFNQVTTV
ncbi:MAG: hypothetical protein AVDCRST_MAG95-496 [uncultured Adhaeribacter sp.]|uniref:Uncharacterized protein n=1 Tax=uncultured Adhaeribacter sp. TaxID=448109 RepID=A0A6J4HEQ9_9BACT|nr:MAG: hypothetical protein AVDCRST_MAG95-496 [uncultured Adhaeribacter sp.]